MKQEYADKQISAHRERQAATYHTARTVWLESYVKAEQASEALRMYEITAEEYGAVLRVEDAAYDAYLVAHSNTQCSDAECLSTVYSVATQQLVEIRRRAIRNDNDHPKEYAL